MSTQSPILIEYVVDGETYTLCAVGGWFAELPRFQAGQELYERDGYLAADNWFVPLGGATGTVTFTTEEPFPTIDDAQAAFDRADVFAGVSLLATSGTLRITAGDTVAEYESAVLEEVEPGLPDDVTDDEDESLPVLTRAFTFLTPAVPVIS